MRIAGSDLNMITAVNNACRFANIDWLESVRMASIYPAKALGLDNELGYIKSGYTENLVALNEQRNITSTWINGAINQQLRKMQWK